MEEKDLVQKAMAGDHASFEQLVICYQTQVYNLALRMVGNDADAQDLAQEAFVRAWRALDSFRFSAQFSTWLYRLTSNICIDFLRAQRRHAALSLTVLQEEADQQWDMRDPKPLPEEALMVQEEREVLLAAIAALDMAYRQILLLRVVSGCSYQQIGKILGLREGTVKSRLARAREQLRKNLAQAGNYFASFSSNPQKGGRSDV